MRVRVCVCVCGGGYRIDVSHVLHVLSMYENGTHRFVVLHVHVIFYLHVHVHVHVHVVHIK